MAVLNTSKRGCTTLWMVPECPVCQMPSTGAFCSLEFMSFMLQRSLCQLYKLCKFVHELIMSDVSDPNVWLKLAIDPINHNLIAWIKQVCKHRSCCHCYDLSGKPASNLAGIDNSKLKIEGQEVFNKSSTEPSRCTFKPHTFSCFFSHIVLVRKGSSLQKAVVPECWLDPNKWCTWGLYKETTQAGPSNNEMLVLILVDVARFIEVFYLQGSKKAMQDWTANDRIVVLEPAHEDLFFRLNNLTMFSTTLLNDATLSAGLSGPFWYMAFCVLKPTSQP